MPIDFKKFPLREIQKGRELAWDPMDFDFTRDREGWPTLTDDERDLILRQVVAFLIGERAVTHDLAPLQQALRREKQRMEEEMYLTQQMFEETNHVMFFQNWMDEVLPSATMRFDPGEPNKGNVFDEILPEALQALNTDRSPRAQMRAAVTYHMFVEGTLAELGYKIFYHCLEKRDVLPGLIAGMHLIQRDESRHIAFGTYFIQRLIRDDPGLDAVFAEEMEKLKPVAREVTLDLLGVYGEGGGPFGLDAEKFLRISDELFHGRMAAVRRGSLVEA